MFGKKLENKDVNVRVGSLGGFWKSLMQWNRRIGRQGSSSDWFWRSCFSVGHRGSMNVRGHCWLALVAELLWGELSSIPQSGLQDGSAAEPPQGSKLTRRDRVLEMYTVGNNPALAKGFCLTASLGIWLKAATLSLAHPIALLSWSLLCMQDHPPLRFSKMEAWHDPDRAPNMLLVGRLSPLLFIKWRVGFF